MNDAAPGLLATNLDYAGLALLLVRLLVPRRH